MGVEGDKGCLSGLETIDCAFQGYGKLRLPRLRCAVIALIYTEAERKFLDYIDEALEETFCSFFKLKSIDYGESLVTRNTSSCSTS